MDKFLNYLKVAYILALGCLSAVNGKSINPSSFNLTCYDVYPLEELGLDGTCETGFTRDRITNCCSPEGQVSNCANFKFTSLTDGSCPDLYVKVQLHDLVCCEATCEAEGMKDQDEYDQCAPGWRKESGCCEIMCETISEGSELVYSKGVCPPGIPVNPTYPHCCTPPATCGIGTIKENGVCKPCPDRYYKDDPTREICLPCLDCKAKLFRKTMQVCNATTAATCGGCIDRYEEDPDMIRSVGEDHKDFMCRRKQLPKVVYPDDEVLTRGSPDKPVLTPTGPSDREDHGKYPTVVIVPSVVLGVLLLIMMLFACLLCMWKRIHTKLFPGSEKSDKSKLQDTSKKKKVPTATLR